MLEMRPDCETCGADLPAEAPGAFICSPTPEQDAAMQEVYAKIQAGEFAAAFGEIKGKAYAG